MQETESGFVALYHAVRHGTFALAVLALTACGGDNGSDSAAPTPPAAGSTPTPSATPQPTAAPSPSASPQPSATPISSVTGARWSDPAAWGGVIPPVGSAVVIPAGKSMVLDVPVDLASLRIEGQLQFDPAKEIELRAGSIQLAGPSARLAAGSESAYHPSRATITLTGARTAQTQQGCGDKSICVMGGSLELFGEPRMSWTRLNASVAAGATQLTLADAPNWRAGDQIVIAPTGVDPFEAEVRTITAVNSRTVTLDKALAYPHFGQTQTYDGITIDTRAEVGLLTRNVVIRGDDASTAAAFGAHVMVMAGGKARISGVEMYRVGQKALFGRYPFHWHMAGDVDGQYFKNSSIHTAYNRFLTIHGSNRALVENNVAYDTIGHGFFLEDGVEVKNVLQGNLGILVRQAKAGEEVRPEFQWPAFVKSDLLPAVFWISHPDNVLRNNVAAGAENGFGFWLSYFEKPTGLSTGSAILPRSAPFGEFSGNVAHSISKNNVYQADYSVQGSGLMMDEYTGVQPARIQDFTVYNVNTLGVWAPNVVMTGLKIADAPYGVLAVGNPVIEDALFVGRTANNRITEAFDPAQNFLDTSDSFAISAATLGMEVRRTRFVNYAGNNNGLNGASTSAAITQRHYHDAARFKLSASRFINTQAFQANPEYDNAPPTSLTDQTWWDDLDGSVSGTPASYRGYGTAGNRAGCTVQASWRLYICPLTP
jgi:cell surface hyaluronidase